MGTRAGRCEFVFMGRGPRWSKPTFPSGKTRAMVRLDRRPSIKHKVTLLFLASTFLVLVLASSLHLWHSIEGMREKTVNELSRTASLLGAQCRGPLLRQDRAAVRSVLEAIGDESPVVVASLHAADGHRLAYYRSPSASRTLGLPSPD